MNLQPIRKEKLPGRNERCPCGSGKKAKKCCLDKIKAFAALQPIVREQTVVARILGHRPFVTRPPLAPGAATSTVEAPADAPAELSLNTNEVPNTTA